jgi:hypothetical protein
MTPLRCAQRWPWRRTGDETSRAASVMSLRPTAGDLRFSSGIAELADWLLNSMSCMDSHVENALHV